MTLMAIAQHTQSVKLAAGIVVPYLRRLSTIAMDALALNEVSGGRVRVGLGVPLWKIAMYGYTLENTRPLYSMRDVFVILKALLRGEPTPRGSDILNMPKGIRIENPRPMGEIPVFFGVHNKLMLRLAGEIGDGVQLGALTYPVYAKWAVKQVHIGAKRAGRDPSEIPIYANILTAIEKDENTARELVMPIITQYTEVFHKNKVDPQTLPATPFRELLETLQKEPDMVMNNFPMEKVADTLAVIGSADQLIQKFEEFRQCGVNYPFAWSVFGATPEQAIREIGRKVLPHFKFEK
jgi:5,10-methylenetetrahydromethanopterin reductase